ncbi:hypothetical protein [uncultured Sphingobacterium sp.]|uniref:hypothetical protein n=1 Tax=uncultured Sphingobacterium sp. TaxID=182688 RepID=UPI0025F83E98|nr:hypothetical protein [uncultured Sphingobacterium sp.]
MKKMERKKYIAPSLKMEVVNTEDGIAAGSALLSGGTINNPHNPEVESYGTELPGGSSSIDF